MQKRYTLVNLDKTFFHSHKLKKGGKGEKRSKGQKQKSLGSHPKKFKFSSCVALARFRPLNRSQSYCTRSFISEMWDALRRYFSHICSLVMSRATWVSTRGSKKSGKVKKFCVSLLMEYEQPKVLPADVVSK